MTEQLNPLLKWSLDPQGQQLDPELLAELFGAKDDATSMMEAMQTIEDPAATLTDKQTAFDNLEMLVENLDNANNLVKLGLWEPILRQLESDEPSLRELAAWVCGTAVQNNSPAQKDFLAQGGVEALLQRVRVEDAGGARAKAISALNSELHNHQAAQEQFERKEGWQVIREQLRSSPSTTPQTRAKAAFMTRTVLSEDGGTGPPLLTADGLPDALLELLVNGSSEEETTLQSAARALTFFLNDPAIRGHVQRQLQPARLAELHRAGVDAETISTLQNVHIC